MQADILYSMQEAIPFKSDMAVAGGVRSRLHNFLEGADNGGGRRLVITDSKTSLAKLVVENAVIVFGRRGCCMCHVVNRLLLGHGVNPAVCEVDEEKEEAVLNELSIVNGGGIQFPAVFMGGKLFGGLDRVMSTHITGELVPILKEAGALWL